MIKIVGRYDPDPEDIILSCPGTDNLDYFAGMDRLAVVGRLQYAAKRTAFNWGLNILIVVVCTLAVCWIVSQFIGSFSTEKAVFIAIAFPILTGLNFMFGVGWVLGAYRRAIETVYTLGAYNERSPNE